MIHETLEKLVVPVDGLVPYPGNPRQGDVGAICQSLERHGQYRPIVVNRRSMEVLAGNHTLTAARQLGWGEIAVTFVDVDADTAARIVLVDNRSNDLAAYDENVLAGLLGSLPDLGGTGYDESDLDDLLRTLNPAGAGDDTEPEAPPEDPVTRLGDLIVLGDHRLVCGDSTEMDDVARLMGDQSAHLVFTDPPYGVEYTGGAKKRERLVADDRDTNIYSAFLPLAVAHSAPDAAFYIWYADLSIAAAAAAAAAGLVVRCQIIWVKNHAQFMSAAHYHGKHEPCIYAGRKGQSIRWYGPTNEVTLWDVDRSPRNDFHPTQKPIALAERALSNSSLLGDVVLDLFGGSGSTLIACENLGRRARVMELDPGYCDVIVDRWERHTGRSAERTRDGAAVEAHA